MKLLMTGGSGVLGRAARALLLEAGHEIDTPRRGELDLFDPGSVRLAVEGADAIMHLATRIPPPEARGDPGGVAGKRPPARRGDADPRRRRAQGRGGALRVSEHQLRVPGDWVGGRVDPGQTSPVPEFARSALVAEQEMTRFAQAGGEGVILRLGLLYGPGTGSDVPAE